MRFLSCVYICVYISLICDDEKRLELGSDLCKVKKRPL